MIDIINKNLHEIHRRKLSEIKQSRMKFIAPPIQSPVSAHGNPKGEYLKQLRQMKIHMDNLKIADKFKEVLVRRTQYPSKSFESHSMNKKTRMHFFQKIRTENKGIMQRIINQKSFYNFSSSRLRPDNFTVHKRSLSRFKTQESSREMMDKLPHELEMLPYLIDDFSIRQVVVSHSATVLERMCMVEISQSRKFDYMTLDFLSLAQKYKLRLSKETGEKMFELYHKDKEGFFQKRIALERGQVVLVLSYPPFLRKYPFKKLLNGARRRAKSTLEGSFNLSSDIFRKELVGIRQQINNAAVNEPDSEYYQVFEAQELKNERDQKERDQS